MGTVVYSSSDTVLTVLDGRDQRQGVLVIGATNRADQRRMILNALGKGRPLDPSVNLNDIGCHEPCHNFSGADLKFLMKKAIMEAQDEAIANSSSSDTSQWTVKVKHFEQVITKISPSVESILYPLKQVSLFLLGLAMASQAIACMVMMGVVVALGVVCLVYFLATVSLSVGYGGG
ncbi:hypothetical protein FEM48_Zijuj11G0017200 [Ziziphus jujuba var. spinosa]|uniref:Uncharacterized protein n=1 Tax=Ziziphus jujuba var. spinosa TaxID=714518 RepID=A0A978UG38_ZIZJJ|nr:hypothetical protein FEM48_Zijuj11G0017200 [Ziziphus jujuba var. spinosa]